jgi:hypothetical protein
MGQVVVRFFHLEDLDDQDRQAQGFKNFRTVQVIDSKYVI